MSKKMSIHVFHTNAEAFNFTLKALSEFGVPDPPRWLTDFPTHKSVESDYNADLGITMLAEYQYRFAVGTINDGQLIYMIHTRVRRGEDYPSSTMLDFCTIYDPTCKDPFIMTQDAEGNFKTDGGWQMTRDLRAYLAKPGILK